MKEASSSTTWQPFAFFTPLTLTPILKMSISLLSPLILHVFFLSGVVFSTAIFVHCFSFFFLQQLFYPSPGRCPQLAQCRTSKGKNSYLFIRQTYSPQIVPNCIHVPDCVCFGVELKIKLDSESEKHRR